MLVTAADVAVAGDGLSLRGSVSSVRIIEDKPDGVLLRLDLDLTLTNDSAANVILYWHEFHIIESSVVRLEEGQRVNVLYRSTSRPSANRSPDWVELQTRLDLKNPPGDLTRTLKSGESLSLKRTENLWISKKPLYQLSWDEILATKPVWLVVDLEMFPSNLDQTSLHQKSFGKKVRKKWKRFGILQVEELQSEPMRLNLTALGAGR
jgi:hypothetical protein